MRTVFVIVAREYLQRVRTKSFIISTIAAPILMLALLLIPAWMGARSAISEREIAVLDRTGVLADGVIPRLESAGFRIERIEPGTAAEDSLEIRLEEKDLAGALYLDQASLDRGHVLWRGDEGPSTLRGISIQQAVTGTALTNLLGTTEQGPAIAALLAGGELEIQTLSEDDRDSMDRAAGMAAAFIGAFFLYMVLLIYGTMVLRAVLEEKTGRIAEVMLSSVRPWQLMLGKVMGVGAVGLTQLGVWIGSILLLFGLGIPAMIPFLPEIPMADQINQFLPELGVFAFFVVCFLLGYFLYASLFAAVGAMCSSEEEAQQMQVPVVMLVVVPIVFVMPIIEDPGSTLAVVLSQIPFFAPILMFARVAAGGAAVWEAAISVVGMVLALFATAWVAGRIYRVGILMQGKRPTLPELWRWVREG